jgi:hypothetical protein
MGGAQHAAPRWCWRFGDDTVRGKRPGWHRVVRRRCRCSLVGDRPGAPVEELVDGVRRMDGVQVGVDEKDTPGGQDLGVDAARGGRDRIRCPSPRVEGPLIAGW